MRIAKTGDNSLVECDGATPQNQAYFCCICGENVHPRNRLKKEDGRIKDYYFAHFSDVCSNSIESYVHKIAKQIIVDSKQINIPGDVFAYENVVTECTTISPLIRPDALLNGELIVEISYRNPKTTQYCAIVRDINLSAIEIDLSKLDFNSSIDEIRACVLTDKYNRRYLHKKILPVKNTSSSSIHNLFWLAVGAFGTWLGWKGLTALVKSQKLSKRQPSRNRTKSIKKRRRSGFH